jgi:hypothetical protein
VPTAAGTAGAAGGDVDGFIIFGSCDSCISMIWLLYYYYIILILNIFRLNSINNNIINYKNEYIFLLIRITI